MMHDVKEMMAELTRNNGPSESSSAEGSAAARGSPRGEEPTAARGSPEGAEPTAAARQISAAGADTAGAEHEDIQQQQETIFREDASRSVGSDGTKKSCWFCRNWPSQGPVRPGKDGWRLWGSYPGGELGIGYDMPLSRRSSQTHPCPTISRGKARIYCRYQRRQVLREKSRFPVCFCIGSTPIHSCRGDWISETRYLSKGGTTAKAYT